ncbi:MAG: GDP-mannose 4,6-dehydratase [Acidobacteria bacterium]|nr:GDP-mannose 4,6-dehydratase [Acidobacteriota bacterium]
MRPTSGTRQAAANHQVIALSRSGDAVPDADCSVIDSLREVAADVDAVCYLAALVRVRDSIADPLAYWRTNVVGTINVLDAFTAKASGAEPKRLVLASTAAVYGDTVAQPISEDTPAVPTNPYGATKLAADQAAADVACGPDCRCGVHGRAASEREQGGHIENAPADHATSAGGAGSPQLLRTAIRASRGGGPPRTPGPARSAHGCG